MTDQFTLTVPGRPIPKGRPRVARGRAYTDPKTREGEQAVQYAWLAAGRPRIATPYRVQCVYTYERKQSRIPGMADLDNLVKLVVDALVGCGAIPDDRQMLELHATKAFGEPATEVTIVSLEHSLP